MQEGKSYFWNIDRIMWLIIGSSLSVGIIWLIYYLRDAFLPFFVACLIAYILQPLVALNQRWTHIKNRAVLAVITVVQVSALLFLLGWLTIPSIIDELGRLGTILHDISVGKIPVPREYEGIVYFVGRYFDPVHISQTLSKMHVSDIIQSGSSLLQESGEVLIHTVEWLLTIIYVFFILIDYQAIVNGFKQIVPQRYRPKAMVIINDVAASVNHYFRGQGKVALFAMIFYCLGFWIVGLPLAVPMGILVGILYMIPYFQYITLLPVAGICVVSSLGGGPAFLPEFGKCLLVYLVSQSVCDYVITPHIMGKELGLNPAIILLSLSVWGSLMGIIGMIIALPVTALIMQYYQIYISNRK